MNGYTIQPPVFDASTVRLLNVVIGMDTAAATLRSMLDFTMHSPGAEAPPWGTDEVGVECGQLYTETVATVHPATDSYRDQIAYAASALRGAIADYRGTDAFGAERLGALTVKVDGESG